MRPSTQHPGLRPSTRLRHLAALLMAQVALTAGCWSDRGGDYPSGEALLNQTLREVSPGAEVAVVDLDAIDHNLRLVRDQLGQGVSLRLVTKSLPSLDLLEYLMQKAETRRLMLFSEPFLDAVLARLGPDLDILLGKPLPATAAARLLDQHPHATTVQWLVDTPDRLEDYLALAREKSLALLINLEIDVGLRRGGAPKPTDLVAMLDVIASHPERLRFSGTMGYDGHVPHVPIYISRESAVTEAFSDVQRVYRHFVEAGRERHPDLFADGLTFNSGGSRTYFRYSDTRPASPVNEVAMGSGFLAPASFQDLRDRGHRAAVYLGSPVSKRVSPGETPFVFGLQGFLANFDPNLADTFITLGGGWPGNPVAPPGLQTNPFIGGNEGGIRNLLSNQAILTGSRSIPIGVGDFIFYDPWEADALVLVDRLCVARSGVFVGWWKTYRGGN